VHVQAAYFINTETAREHYEDRRQEADFRAIVRALRQEGHWSLIEVAGGRRSSGRAVEVGKASPEDIKLFVEEALNRGSVQAYAEEEGVLTEGQQLTELEEDAIQTVIQNWIRHVGIGVDCSGFVLQAAIGAREALRHEEARAGRPEEELPGEISHRERSAASFRSEPEVETPAELRPGDAWVVSGGGHIRIVSAVREVPLESGGSTIEFETAESSGGSTQPSPGPVGRTWRTSSTEVFSPISARSTGAEGANVVGSFHRLP
jgi:hypothetical protein